MSLLAAVAFAGSFARPAVAAGDPIDLIGTVREAGAPVLGATVVARVVRPDGTFIDITLADDGTGTDATAGDGVYSARLAGTAQPGLYKVAFTARGTRSTGAAFSREGFGLAMASSGRATFTKDLSIGLLEGSYDVIAFILFHRFYAGTIQFTAHRLRTDQWQRAFVDNGIMCK